MPLGNPDSAGNYGTTVTYALAKPLSVTTNATGSTYNAFPAQVCTSLDIVNNTGVEIEYLRNGETISIPIPNNGSRQVVAITDASQVSVRRTDLSNTQVTVKAEGLS